MPIPLVDLQQQYRTIKSEIDTAIADVLTSGQFVLGKYVQTLEKEIADYCHVPHAIGVASGTDALLLALKALNIGPGDEVIVPPFTFFATAGAVHNCGARPVFCDIEAESFMLDPAKLPQHITSKTKAIIPVHLFGQCAQMDRITEIARAHKLSIIEDAAQAIGALFQGQHAGSLGAVGCFSFFPTKNLGCYGDGGMVVTSDEAVAEQVRLLRVHGGGTQYYHKLVGINSRLDGLQAAILSAKLPFLDKWSAKRRENAAYYNTLFNGSTIVTPVERTGNYCIYNQYTLRIKRRDKIMAELKARGIGCAVYYPLPLHLQECFAYLGHKKGDFPVSELASEEVLSLPIFSELTQAQQREIAETVIEASQAS